MEIATTSSSKDAAAEADRIKIRDQMEFYFSDSNLSKDRFLLNEIKKSPDGCKKK